MIPKWSLHILYQSTSITPADGCGLISRQLLDEVLARVRHAPRPRDCCGLQIRLGGVKGVVFVHPGLQGRKLLYRCGACNCCFHLACWHAGAVQRWPNDDRHHVWVRQ